MEEIPYFLHSPLSDDDGDQEETLYQKMETLDDLVEVVHDQLVQGDLELVDRGI